MGRRGDKLNIKIDFNSDEALYIQLKNQIIFAIATSSIEEGKSLPSVRDLADEIGINMHTVNKTYTILKQEGYLQLDRRKGAVISVNRGKEELIEELNNELRVILAKGICGSVTCQEMKEIIKQIYDEFEGRQ